MIKYLVKVYPWENPLFYSGKGGYTKNEKVVVETEIGNYIGTIFSAEIHTEEKGDENLPAIVRKMTARDEMSVIKNEGKKEEILKICKEEVQKSGLEMKISDIFLSLDKSNILVVFTAKDRVDFRSFVKKVSSLLRRSIKMKQIGSRDEAKMLGGCGICGKELCCVKFFREIPSISTEMARVQQIAHRGSDRISGLCGRLKCCLSYEYDQYREMLEGMPEIYSHIETKEGSGEVIDLNVIKQEIRVKLDNGTVISIKKKDL